MGYLTIFLIEVTSWSGLTIYIYILMSKMLAQRYHKKMLECNKNNHKSTKIIVDCLRLHPWCNGEHYTATL
jgi:hypothetical protein